MEQAAEPAEPELDMGVDMDVEDEQGGTIGPGRGNMSETARDAGACHFMTRTMAYKSLL